MLMLKRGMSGRNRYVESRMVIAVLRGVPQIGQGWSVQR